MTFGEAIGLVGLVVSVVGFWLAIVQLRRTAKATKATADGISQTLHRMNVNHMLVLLPQLRLIESDLDQAAEEEDRRLAQRTLVSYSHTASQVAMLLEGSESPGDSQLIEKLRGSARRASQAKAALVSSNRVSVKTAIKEVGAEVGDIAGIAAGLIAQYQTKVA